ncbi:hypothetical protein VNO80_06496 [Phaseolus coccineus]|uniref:Uncharacterized protein n=1 Tax=Phaseolus coccineus TaxID=3886 RepID=A0AAN9RIS2_PHACN
MGSPNTCSLYSQIGTAKRTTLVPSSSGSGRESKWKSITVILLSSIGFFPVYGHSKRLCITETEVKWCAVDDVRHSVLTNFHILRPWLRRSGGGSKRFESFKSGGNGIGGGSVNDVINDGVAMSMTDFVLEFMHRSTTLVELLCVGIVPT